MDKKCTTLKIVNVILMPLIAIVDYIIIEIGNMQNIAGPITFRNAIIQNIIINIIVIFFFLLIGFLFTNKTWLISLVSLAISLINSIANYYTVIYHGTPLTFQELRNATTALTVVNNYKFTPDKYVVGIVILFVIGVVICLIERKYVYNKIITFDNLENISNKDSIKDRVVKNNLKSTVIKDVLIIILIITFFYVEFFSSHPFIDVSYEGYVNLTNTYKSKGYVSSQVFSFISLFDDVIGKPDDYDTVTVRDIVDSYNKAGNYSSNTLINSSSPDIIFIMNETFYDPVAADPEFQTDVDYLANISEMRRDEKENLIFGYSVMQDVGGTNRSEYEFMTSNSLNLYKTAITPMYALDLTSANSFISVLKQNGYRTLGTHCSVASNYNRFKGYQDLGFDVVYFEEDYDEPSYYGERDSFMSDESVYNNLIRWYEDESTSGPLCMYVMTIQNHGGYTGNPDYMDTVHVLDDYGEYTDQINEYLSCISESDKAFKQLTNYFKTVDRDVIICMLGDHGPNMSYLLSDDYSEDDAFIAMRATPLVIWSNYKLNERGDIGYISENYVVPYVLNQAGVKISDYYRYILNMYEEYPVLADGDLYIDKDGKYNHYSDGLPEIIKNYYYLEYNNLSKDRVDSVFIAR